ncbi:MAG: phage tail spike protein [Coprococcus sp.]
MEDFSYTTEVRISAGLLRTRNPYQMLEYTQMRLAEYAQPRVSYVLSAMDLSALTGYEHGAWALGDIVTVDDKDLNLSVGNPRGAPPVQFAGAVENCCWNFHYPSGIGRFLRTMG